MAKMDEREINIYVKKFKNPDDQKEAREILSKAELTKMGSFVSSEVIDKLEAIEKRNAKATKRR